MTLYAFKPRFQALLRPLVRGLHALGVTANQVTIAAGVGSVVLGAALALGATTAQPEVFLLLPIWLLLRMALNAIDGLLAREFGQASTLGAYLNELCDVTADAALYLPFGLLGENHWAPAIVVVFLANLSEMASVLAITSGRGRRNDGPLGKSDRALVFGVAGLLVGSGVAPDPWLTWVLAAVAVLLLLTTVNRVRRGVADSAPLDH